MNWIYNYEFFDNSEEDDYEDYYDEEEDELIALDWQYTNIPIEEFKVGGIVFLKSNPEQPLRIIAIEDNIIKCLTRYQEIFEAPSQCFMFYAIRSQQICKRKYNVSFN